MKPTGKLTVLAGSSVSLLVSEHGRSRGVVFYILAVRAGCRVQLVRAQGRLRFNPHASGSPPGLAEAGSLGKCVAADPHLPIVPSRLPQSLY